MLRHVEPLTGAYVLGVTLLLAMILVICLGLGTAFGAGTITITNLLPGNSLTAVEKAIMFEVRLPRVLVAGLLGGALSIAGVVFQALLRNPLADPYVLGVSGGASIGGVIALLLGLGTIGGLLGDIAIPAFAFAGALGALLLIESIATVGGQLTVYTILLTGVIFNAFAAAFIYFIQSIASLQQLHEIVFYLMGRIPSLGYRNLLVLAIAIMLASFALLLLSRNFNALSLGEESAMQLGVDVEKLKRHTFVLGSLLTGLCVAVAGLIGFVGLVVPHMLRMLLGPDHRLLLPAAFLGGAGFLVLADLAARLLLAPGELPVGVVTALIGGPFFLYLLRTRSRLYGFQ
jgi:iron complex transport system permease protein